MPKDLQEQFPKDIIVPTIDEELPEDAEHIHFDAVIPLAKDKYTEAQALTRFSELLALRKARAVGSPFATAQYWALRIINVG